MNAMCFRTATYRAFKQLYRRPGDVVPLLRKHPLLPRPANAFGFINLLSRTCASSHSTKAASTDTADAPHVLQHEASTPAIQPVAEAEPLHPFQDLGVDERLVVNLSSIKISDPSPIQSAAIPAIIKGGNCAIQSYTGSGKTLAYLLPTITRILQLIEENPDSAPVVRAIVVAPSQELCMQIVNVAKALLPPEARDAVQQCIGGANMKRQVEALKKNKPALVVGTPGRLASLGREAKLMVHNCSMLVVDEADQLLADSFIGDMNWLAEHSGKRVSNGRQTVLVSATLTRSLLQKTSKICPNPDYISIGQSPHTAVVTPTTAPAASPSSPDGSQAPIFGWGAKGWDGPASDLRSKMEGSIGGVEGGELVPSMPPNLRHVFVVAPHRHRVDMLRRVIYALGIQQSLVFMNFQQRLQDTQFKLASKNMEVAILHGDLDKLQRAAVLREFRKGSYRALVVSDVLARGLDVPDCDAVFNLELPSNAAHYAHRAGRTGRMGAPGTVVSLVEGGERWVIEKLAKKLQVPILEVSVEGGEVKLAASEPPVRKSKADIQQQGSEEEQRQDSRSTQAGSADPPRAARGKDSATSTSTRSSSRDSAPADSSATRSSGRDSATSSSTRGSSRDSALKQGTEKTRGGNKLGDKLGDRPLRDTAGGLSKETNARGGKAAPGRVTLPAAQRGRDAVDDGVVSEGSRGRRRRDSTGSKTLGLEDELWGRESWHPQQKAKIEKYFRQANVDLREVLEISDDDDDDDNEVDDEVVGRGRRGGGGGSGGGGGGGKKGRLMEVRRVKDEVASELAEIKAEKKRLEESDGTGGGRLRRSRK